MLYLKGLKKSHKISRLVQIAIAITLMIGLVQLWQTSLLQGQQLLKSQTQKMARLLVQQTAYGAAPALQLQNDEQLQWLTSALVEDPKVISAAIFSEQGIRLAFAQHLTKDSLDPESEEMNRLLSKYPPFVEPVIQDGKNLGYVELRLDTKLFFDEIKEAHHLNMEQQQMMLLVAGLIGMLLSRALSYKRAHFDRRRARVKLYQKLRQAAKKDKPSAPKALTAEEINAASTGLAPTVKQTESSVLTEKSKMPLLDSSHQNLAQEQYQQATISMDSSEEDAAPNNTPKVAANTNASTAMPELTTATSRVKTVRRIKPKTTIEAPQTQPNDLDSDTTG